MSVHHRRLPGVAVTACAVAAIALSLTGCASSGGPPDAAASSPAGAPASTDPEPSQSPALKFARTGLGAHCVTEEEQKGAVRFASDNGAQLDGIVFGEGTTAVVLAHQSDGDVCQWSGYARHLAGLGYSALTFNFAGRGGSDPDPADGPARLQLDVVGAVKMMRERGATHVVLVGASMGGTAILAATPLITPPVDAIVDLSGPEEYNGVDARPAYGKITVPGLFIAGDQDYQASRSVSASHFNVASQERKLEIVSGSPAHGVGLLDPGYGADRARQIQDKIDEFIKTHTS